MGITPEQEAKLSRPQRSALEKIRQGNVEIDNRGRFIADEDGRPKKIHHSTVRALVDRGLIRVSPLDPDRLVLVD